MNISDNISYILSSAEGWSFYTNRSYTAQIQKADPEKVYNVPGKPGVVYNFFEDTCERVCEGGYVITGAAGEMWPVGAGAVGKYGIAPEDITSEPQSVNTVETGAVFAAVRIPPETEFTLETDYGEKALLKGNRPGIGHGDGDLVMVAAKEVDGAFVPDLSDSGRIVNGTLFDTLYKPLSAQ